MWHKIKEIFERDVLLTVLLIISLTVTCVMILSAVSYSAKYDELVAEYTDENGNFIENKGIVADDYENLLGVQIFNKYLMGIITLFSVFNFVLVTGVWFTRRRFEFAVRKAFGSTVFMIVRTLISELLVVAVVALLFAVLIYISGVIAGINGFEIHGNIIKNCFEISGCCLLVVVVAIGLNISKISRLTPVELINNGKC
ncbi:MAG: FtsX-like permease family protein [Lachnospiraceae bacterium]